MSSVFYHPSGGGPNSAPAAWAAHAADLATWSWQRLVNRVDAWGAYWPLDRREQGNSWTAPARLRRGQVFLNEEILARHYRGQAVEHVIGLHTTSTANTSLWGAVEVDRHGDQGNDPAANLAAVLAWDRRLRELGFLPLLTESNGRGGYHLRLLFRDPIPTERVHALLQWLSADHARHGIPHRPETFPKQPRIGLGQYGNWLRLPGRHHTRDHWSRVWDGEHWLEGTRAIEHILVLQGDSPDLLPAEVAAAATRPARPVDRPSVFCRRVTSGAGQAARIAAYLQRLPNLAEGQGRDDVAYHFACWLVRDLQLPDETALAWLVRWDEGNAPPKGEERLRQVIRSAHAYGRQAYGSGLNAHRPDRHDGPRSGRNRLHFSFSVEATR